ncbi:ABC transporter substrate-binding protein, partial [Eggerthella lenta]
MKTRARTFIAALTVMATMAGLTSCAHSQPEPGYPICTENEIVTYEPTDTTKTVITIGRYTIFNSEPLQKALSERIPEASFAFVDAPGTNDVRAYVKEQAERNDLPDMVFSGMRVGSGEYAYDLSAEGFTGRYNLSALEKLSVDGALRQLPINSSVKGIFYNKTLFEEHGWEIPTTLDEFYDLCDAITAEGIRPFVPCLKYSVQDVGLGLTSREVFGTSEKRARYDDVVNKEASCEGLLEPYYETLKQLYDRGIVVESDFTSSLTQNRQAMYAGEIAMIPSDLSMYSLYEQEKPGCEIDFIGFPTDTPNERWMQMSLGVNMMASQKSMEDPQKKRILLDALDFLSSDEGQAVLFECFSGISNVKSYQQNIRPEFWDVKNCLDAGSIYFADRVGMTSDFETAFEWMRGNMTMQEIIEATDDFAPCNLYESMETPVIGKAAEDFTVLETSNLIADAMRDASGADVALLINNYYY